MRAIIAETVQSWDVPALWVGCSGNFTIEHALPGMECHGNDVTLYSSAIGWWAANQNVPITLKPEAEDLLGWIRPGMSTPAGIVATVMLGTRFFGSVGKDNVYHQRQVEAHRAQWDSLLERTMKKLEVNPVRLASYACRDIREWLTDDVPADAAIACFPPFFAGDYESQGEVLEQFLDWPAPSYPLLDEVGKVDMLNQITQRPHWIIGLHRRWEHLEDNLSGLLQTTNRGVPIYMYSSDGPTRVVSPRQKTERVTAARLGSDTVLTGVEQVSLAVLTGGQFAALRSQYMNHSIKPGSPLVALAVMVDGLIAGCIAFGTPNNKIDAHSGYLLSDFPVTSSKYARLAALMVRVAQSTEVRALLERQLSRRIVGISTTAFTNRPVSMKYRNGGMKVDSRKPGDDGIHAYQLQYGAPSGRWTLAEAYEQWWKRNGALTTDVGKVESE